MAWAAIPKARPVAIEKVKGMSATVRKAGSASSGSFHATSAKGASIIAPTSTSAGAVAAAERGADAKTPAKPAITVAAWGVLGNGDFVTTRPAPRDPENPGTPMRLSTLAAVLVAAVALSSAACHPHAAHGAHQPHHKIVTTSPIVKEVTITQQYVCQINSQRRINIKPLVSGYLEAISVKEGQVVKKGDVLFRILPVLYKAALDSEAAEAKLAEIEYEKSKQLRDQKVISDTEVLLFEAKYAKAAARVKKAEAELKFTTITAPFDGIMDRLLEQEGSLVKESDALTGLYDNSVMWVYFNVPEGRYLEYMAAKGNPNESAQVELVLANGGKFSYPASALQIMGRANNDTGTIQFRADFENPERLLRHGQTGTILIHRRLAGAVVIPQRATFEILDKQYVYVVDKDGKVHQRAITVLHELEDVYVIGQGVTVDDRIVVEGVREVHDGETLTDVEFRPADQILGKQKFHAE